MPVCTHNISWEKVHWTNLGNLASILEFLQCWSKLEWKTRAFRSGPGIASSKAWRELQRPLPREASLSNKTVKVSCIYTYLHVFYQLEI